MNRSVSPQRTSAATASTHVGGNGIDGYIDAILGVLGVMLECKLNTTPLVRPDIAEAAKYRDQYGAQHAIMVANAYRC